MRILIVGGTGTMGKAVVKELTKRHEVIIAAHEHGDVMVDMENEASIKNMYESVGEIDAVIATAGIVKFESLTEMHDKDYDIGLKNKLMGQINLVLIGLNYIRDHGSFSLISGIINRDPIPLGTSAGMVNGAIEGFVKNAAIEMPRNIRINVISPTVLTESMQDYAEYFRGFVPVDAEKVAIAFSKSIEGKQTGQVYCVG